MIEGIFVVDSLWEKDNYFFLGICLLWGFLYISEWFYICVYMGDSKRSCWVIKKKRRREEEENGGEEEEEEEEIRERGERKKRSWEVVVRELFGVSLGGGIGRYMNYLREKFKVVF